VFVVALAVVILVPVWAFAHGLAELIDQEMRVLQRKMMSKQAELSSPSNGPQKPDRLEKLAAGRASTMPILRPVFKGHSAPGLDEARGDLWRDAEVIEPSPGEATE
jgi:hypothetical protein